MSGIGFVRDEDKEEYRKFCMHHARGFARALPAELWHYTDANGLIAILQTGKIWSTQITCLNDSLEQRYFGDLVHAVVKTRRAQNTDSILDPLFRVADDALANRDFAPVGQFVACFSEVEDDLGQWRGYGGGECGYAIGFRSQGVLDAAQSRPGSLLVPMNYEDNRHIVIVNDVVRMGEIYFRQGVSRGLPDAERWAREFVAAFDYELGVLACVVKHPKFSGEVERRIVTLLQPGEHMALQFRQKRTLLARHLPLNLTSTVDGKRLLPLSRVYVGPGPAQKVSRISVGDLLMQAGYGGVPVEKSKVPYRLP
jgi:hypothetical protein